MTLRSLIFAIVRIRNYADDLNRRVSVEAQMLSAAEGKRPMPDAAQLREWATKLGVPDWLRRKTK